MTGYTILAKVIGARNELSIFKKFSRLGAQNLLRMQAELLDLELELKQIAQDRSTAGLDQSWSKYGTYGSDNAQIWRIKHLELGEKMEAYHEALLRTEKINALPAPRRYDFDFLQRWLRHKCGGDFFLHGIEAAPFEEHSLPDLVMLSGRDEPGDGLAEYICTRLVPVYHRFIGHRIHRSMPEEIFAGMWEYKTGRVKEVGNSLCMLLSALVPATSVFVLYFMPSTVIRLGAIAVMSFIVSLLMTFVIRGSRGETFAATTAFGALMVVFLGGTNVE